MTTLAEDKEFGSYFLDRIIEWVMTHLNPEDVFGYSELKEWALDNGFEEQESEYIIGRR